MNPVARFETFVERLMERTLTRSSHSRLQPVEIAKRLARVMDADQVVGALGVRVPNIFDVDLSSVDFAQFKPIQSSVTAEIEAYLARVARDRMFVLASPPIVRLHTNQEMHPGEIGVHAHMEDIRPAATAARVGRDEPAVPQYTRPMQAVQPTAPAAPRRHASQLLTSDRSFRLEASPVNVGRAAENDVVVDDRRISRRHAQLVQANGSWMVRDLGSTNGTAVNGKLVKQAALQDGDRLSLGGFEVVFQE